MKNHTILLFFLLLLLVACKKEQPELRIGYSFPLYNIGWTKFLHDEMLQEVELYPEENIQIILHSAESDANKQNHGMLDLYYKEKIDVLVVNIYDISKSIETIKHLHNQGLKIISVGANSIPSEYGIWVGFSDVEFGREAAKYAEKILQGNGSIIEIKGSPGKKASLRSSGFWEEISKYPDMKITASIEGRWQETITASLLDSVLKTGLYPDLIYAHNDGMGRGARKACVIQGIDPYIISIDGLNKKGFGMDMVEGGIIDATFYNRPAGDVCVDLALKMMRGEKVESVMLKTFRIDKSNVKSIRSGFDLLNKQKDRFYRMEEQINALTHQVKLQKVLNYLVSALMILLASVFIIILIFLRQKQGYIKLLDKKNKDIEKGREGEKELIENLSKANKLLKEKSQEIESKNKTLEIYQTNLEGIVEERTKELTIALNRAMESDELKNSFISNLSHEIRTPINAIAGFSELISGEEVTPQLQKEYLDIAKHSSFELIRIIDNILEISLISSGQTVISTKVFRLKEFMNKFYKNFLQEHSLNLKDSNQGLNLILDEIPDIAISSDETRIRQILSQLTENAVKFTHRGEIRLGVKKTEQNELIFYVSDTGIGISNEFHEVIFNKFRKIEIDKDVLYRGNGLGLTIVKHLVERMNGKVWLESELNIGSTFFFSIQPQPHAEKDFIIEKAISKGSKFEFPKSQILIAEDEDANFLYLKTLLLDYPVQVIRAYNGLEAVEICKENPNIDVVLMDIKMPIMNGKEAFNHIHQLKPNIPVVAITAYALAGDRENLLNKGFNAYLSKPVKARKLIDTLKEVLPS